MKDYLTVRKSDGLCVFGYKAGFLRSVTNESPGTICLRITCAEHDTKHVVLQEKETCDLNVNIWECIRNRFMPYVETEDDVLLSVAWETQEPGSSVSDIQTRIPDTVL